MNAENTRRWTDKGKDLIYTVGNRVSNQDALIDILFAMQVWADRYGFDFESALSESREAFKEAMGKVIR